MSPRRWSILSLVMGFIWLICSLAPTFITTLIGLPFLAAAMWAGWRAHVGHRANPDSPALWLANSGLGLGCLGCAWLSVFYLSMGVLVVSFILSGLAAAWAALPAVGQALADSLVAVWMWFTGLF